MARDGTKTGGRVKGSINRKLPAVKRMAQAGELPLEFMLRFMRDETQEDNIRMDMAKAAAPYLHSKLAPVNPESDKNETVDYEAIGKSLAKEMDEADSAS